MPGIWDSKEQYGSVSRWLHWGMAILFFGQFVTALAHWGLPREHALRELVWPYHSDLGATLFLLVMIRGVWGLMNIPKRPAHDGFQGRAAVSGHLLIYALMILVPFSRLLSAAGSERGLSYLGIQIFPSKPVEMAWTQPLSDWHGEMGWALTLVLLGHIAMALVWHGMIKRDDVLQQMLGANKEHSN